MGFAPWRSARRTNTAELSQRECIELESSPIISGATQDIMPFGHHGKADTLKSEASLASRCLPDGRPSGGKSVASGYPVTQEKSRNRPELFSKLAWSGWLCRLPQFDRISLRVMQAGEPAVGIRLRVHLDLDSSGL